MSNDQRMWDLSDPSLMRRLEQKLVSLARSGMTTLPRVRVSVPEELLAEFASNDAAFDASPHDAAATLRRQDPPHGGAVAHRSTTAELMDGESGSRAMAEADGQWCTAAEPADISSRGSAHEFAAGRRGENRESGQTEWLGEPSLEDRRAALQIIQQEVRSCTRCPVLAKSRTQTVFGVGDPDSPIVFFGEAPGADEDRLGEPFVGRAGQLLTKIIEACGWKRSEVYIMNVLKCRPPGNRTPTGDETDNCRPFFERQFDIIRPQYICCLGATAAYALLGNTQTIGKLRGRFHAWRGAKVLVTYHPAYLLRNPDAKRLVWEDMKMLLRDMGRKI